MQRYLLTKYLKLNENVQISFIRVKLKAKKRANKKKKGFLDGLNKVFKF